MNRSLAKIQRKSLSIRTTPSRMLSSTSCIASRVSSIGGARSRPRRGPICSSISRCFPSSYVAGGAKKKRRPAIAAAERDAMA